MGQRRLVALFIADQSPRLRILAGAIGYFVVDSSVGCWSDARGVFSAPQGGLEVAKRRLFGGSKSVWDFAGGTVVPTAAISHWGWDQCERLAKIRRQPGG